MTIDRQYYQSQLDQIEKDGLYKNERVISSAQDVVITTAGSDVLNFCANNYLGLANHPKLIETAVNALHSHGFGMASVRFICGTQDLHKQLEDTISEFLQTEDSILYSSCFDANAGLFETLLNEQDAVISDSLNHASIIDGIRLCKAKRFRYAHSDMNDLEQKLKEAQSCEQRLIATDGVFSMDGDTAKLKDIVYLAQKYSAMIMVDDSHATGVLGDNGKGSAELCGVLSEVDIITSTLGKALGGASGGFTAAAKPVVQLLRQRSRPYLFSNTLTPALAAAAIESIKLAQQPSLRRQLMDNTRRFRTLLKESGFDIKPGDHPIIPIMLYDAGLAQHMAEQLLQQGIYVIGFSYPVVPKGQARIRVQISANHTEEQLNRAITAFKDVGKQLGVIK